MTRNSTDTGVSQRCVLQLGVPGMFVISGGGAQPQELRLLYISLQRLGRTLRPDVRVLSH